MRSGPVLRCLGAAALFGSATPAAKVALATVPPVTLAGLLYLGAGLAVLPFALRAPPRTRPVDARNRRRLGLAVLLGGAVAPALALLALSRAPSASISIWLNLEMVLTALLARALFREHLGRAAVVGIALVFAASVWLASPDPSALAPAATLALGASLAWAFDNNLTAVIDAFTPAQITIAKGLLAGTANLALGAVTERVLPDARSVALALAIGAVGYGASIVLYIRGAQELGAARSQVIFASAPLFGLLGAWTVLGEPVLAAQLGAAALVALGVVLVSRSRHTHAHVHDAVTHTHSHRHSDDHHGHAHDGAASDLEHSHEHTHAALAHDHPHAPDLHHRHRH